MRMLIIFMVVLILEIICLEGILGKDPNTYSKEEISQICNEAFKNINMPFYDNGSFLYSAESFNYSLNDLMLLDNITVLKVGDKSVINLKDESSGSNFNISIDVRNKKIDGKVKLLDGMQYYEMTFSKGKPEGVYRIYKSPAKKILLAESTYIAGVIDGALRLNDSEGKLKLLANFKRGVLHGDIKWFYSSREIWNAEFDNGNGIYKSFNGDIPSTFENFKNGKLDGLQYTFDIKGDISSIINFTNGVKGSFEINIIESGELYLVTNYHENLMSGPSYEVEKGELVIDTLIYYHEGDEISKKEYLIKNKDLDFFLKTNLKSILEVINNEKK